MIPLFLVSCLSAPVDHPPLERPGNQWGGQSTEPPLLDCVGRLRILSGAGLLADAGVGTPLLEVVGASLDGLGRDPVAVGDLDGDGATEVAVGEGSSSVRILTSGQIAAGVPVEPLSLPNLSVYGSGQDGAVLAPGDLTGDGVPELVGSYDTHLYVWGAEALGGGGPAAALDGSLRAGLAGDTDGDGVDELVLRGPDWSVEAPVAGLYRRPLSGDPEPDLTLVGFQSVTALGDVDGDGCDDLAGHTLGDVSVLLGCSSASGEVGAADAQWTLPVPDGPSDDVIALGDVDGDGNADLGFVTGTQLTVYASAGSEAPEQPDLTIPWPLGVLPRVVAADLDGDGRAEILLLSFWTDAHFHLTLSIYDGPTLDGSTLIAADHQVELGEHSFAEGEGYRDARLEPVGDLDGDGAVDLAFGEPGWGCAD